jgi:hypothetical protein
MHCCIIRIAPSRMHHHVYTTIRITTVCTIIRITITITLLSKLFQYRLSDAPRRAAEGLPKRPVLWGAGTCIATARQRCATVLLKLSRCGTPPRQRGHCCEI